MNSHNDSRHVAGFSLENGCIVVAMTYPRPHGITVCAIPCGTSQTAMPVFNPNFMRRVPGLRCAYPGLFDSCRPFRADFPVYQCCYGRDHFILRIFCGDYMGYLFDFLQEFLCDARCRRKNIIEKIKNGDTLYQNIIF